MKERIIIIALVCLAGCSSSQKKPTSETQQDMVLERIDGLRERPEWLKESNPFVIENGIVSSLGQTEIPGDNLVNSAYRIAENNAKGSVSHAIEQRLDFVFQNAEEGTTIDTSQTRYIGAEASKLTTSSMRLSKRYYEKIAHTNDDGSRVTRYKVFALVQMPEADFKKAILGAARKQEGKGLSAEFSRQIADHWQNFVNGSGSVDPKKAETTDTSKPTQDKREPASEQKAHE